jgi:hypothetical protein
VLASNIHPLYVYLGRESSSKLLTDEKEDRAKTKVHDVNNNDRQSKMNDRDSEEQNQTLGLASEERRKRKVLETEHFLPGAHCLNYQLPLG